MSKIALIKAQAQKYTIENLEKWIANLEKNIGVFEDALANERNQLEHVRLMLAIKEQDRVDP